MSATPGFGALDSVPADPGMLARASKAILIVAMRIMAHSPSSTNRQIGTKRFRAKWAPGSREENASKPKAVRVLPVPDFSLRSYAVRRLLHTVLKGAAAFC